VEGAVGVEQPGVAGEGARKLDGCFDAFTPGTREKDLPQTSAGAGAKFFSQLSRQFGNVALQHGGTASIQFVVERLYNRRVIVACVMDAVAGKEIENAPAIAREELGSDTAVVASIHLQDFEQPHPVRVDMICIERVESGGCVCQDQSFLRKGSCYRCRGFNGREIGRSGFNCL
jgi:hypothetical protein